MRPTAVRRRAHAAALAVPLLVGLGATAVHAAPALPAAPVARAALPAAVDPFQPYVPQDSCDATPKPGAVAFLALLQATYPGTGNLGVAVTCAQEGMTSEHSEGRALDWGVRATDPVGRLQAQSMLTWLFADDPVTGEKQVMARRLGIMYVIWDGRIRSAGGDWRLYQPITCWGPAPSPTPPLGAMPTASPSPTLSPAAAPALVPTGNVTQCHRDHVHISLGWSGAWQRTSFWTGQVAPIDYGPCQPVAGTPAPAWSYVNLVTCPPPVPPAKPTPVAAPVAGPVPYVPPKPPPVLKVGSRGTAVAHVQRRLAIPVTGRYDGPTARAVMAWQRAQGFPPSGMVRGRSWVLTS